MYQYNRCFQGVISIYMHTYIYLFIGITWNLQSQYVFTRSLKMTCKSFKERILSKRREKITSGCSQPHWLIFIFEYLLKPWPRYPPIIPSAYMYMVYQTSCLLIRWRKHVLAYIATTYLGTINIYIYCPWLYKKCFYDSN